MKWCNAKNVIIIDKEKSCQKESYYIIYKSTDACLGMKEDYRFYCF